MAEIRRRRISLRRLKFSVGRVARDAAQGVKQLLPARSAHILGHLHFSRRLHFQRAEVMHHCFEIRRVLRGHQVRHGGSLPSGGWIGQKCAHPFGRHALRYPAEIRTAPRRQTRLAAMAVATAEFIVEKPSAVLRRHSGVKTFEPGHERLGMQPTREDEQRDRQTRSAEVMHVWRSQVPSQKLGNQPQIPIFARSASSALIHGPMKCPLS